MPHPARPEPSPDPTEGGRPLTSADIKRMSEAEILAFWKRQQRERRGAGEPSYDRLVDPETGETVATVE